MTDPAVTLARMLAASRNRPGTELLRGTVQSWDAVNGYLVAVGGAVVAVTTILSPAAGTIPGGDVVALLRYKSTVLVLGKTAAPS